MLHEAILSTTGHLAMRRTGRKRRDSAPMLALFGQSRQRARTMSYTCRTTKTQRGQIGTLSLDGWVSQAQKRLSGIFFENCTERELVDQKSKIIPEPRSQNDSRGVLLIFCQISSDIVPLTSQQYLTKLGVYNATRHFSRIVIWEVKAGEGRRYAVDTDVDTGSIHHAESIKYRRQL